MKISNMTILLLVMLFIVSVFPAEVYAAGSYTVAVADVSKDSIDAGCYTAVKSYSTFSAAYEAMLAHKSEHAVVRSSTGKVIAMKNGMVITRESSSSIFIFTSLFGNGYSPYTSLNEVGYYIENNSATSAKIVISGYTGNADVSDMILIPAAFCYPYNQVKNRYEFDYYTKNSSGDLVHYISTYSSSNGGATNFSSIVIDKAPEFMEKGVRYYSTDGYVYYLDPIDAVRGENEVGRHCIYYKNLSYRTPSNYTAGELKSYIQNATDECVYVNSMSAFITGQEKYGVNAAMELAFANHESGFGTSSLAYDKYNFFGLGAEDDAFGNANSFISPEACILNHTKYHMSRFYFDAYAYIDSSLGTKYYDVSDKDAGYIEDYAGDPTYFGTNPGNKKVGVNVRYASDPFHGEKVARHMYALDKYLGFKDYGLYSIGMTNKITYAYRNADTASWKLYKYSCKDRNRSGGKLSSDPVGMMVTIVGEEGDFYKILSDMPVNKDGYACYTWEYDRNYSYAYVLKSDIDLMYDCGNISAQPPSLKSLTVQGQNITLNSGVYSYAMQLKGSFENFSVSAVPSSTSDSVSVSAPLVETGKINEIKITVTNKEGLKAEYVVNVYVSEDVALADSTELKSLSSENGSFTENFDPELREYTMKIPDISKDISFEFTPASSFSRTEIIGGKNEGDYRLYTIIVTSHSGNVGYYRIRVVKS